MILLAVPASLNTTITYKADGSPKTITDTGPFNKFLDTGTRRGSR
jgi:hypothetical protein